MVEEDKITYEDRKVYFNCSANDSVSDVNLLSYFWDFDDGTTSNLLTMSNRNTTHLYTNKGSYDVKLIVTDDDDAQCIKIIKVDVRNVKPRCEAMEDRIVNEDQTIKFSCTSSSDSKSDMDTLEYSWDFGISGIPPTPWNSTDEFEYEFKNEGEYIVTLTVRDDDHDTGTSSMKVQVNNVEPEAKFLSSAKSVKEDELVEFDARTSTDTKSDILTLTYTWNFGDGSEKAEGMRVYHRYYKSDVYVVKLTVTDDNSDSNTAKKNVEVTNVKPVPVIKASEITVYVDDTIMFSGIQSSDTASDHANLSYGWDFGDDSAEGEGVTTEHIYESAGTFVVTLTVTDDDNSQQTKDIRITVLEKSTDDTQETDEGDYKNVDLAMIGVVIGLVIVLLLLFIVLTKKPKPTEPPTGDQAKAQLIPQVPQTDETLMPDQTMLPMTMLKPEQPSEQSEQQIIQPKEPQIAPEPTTEQLPETDNIPKLPPKEEKESMEEDQEEE
jgi:PKD repeat protein